LLYLFQLRRSRPRFLVYQPLIGKPLLRARFLSVIRDSAPPLRGASPLPFPSLSVRWVVSICGYIEGRIYTGAGSMGLGMRAPSPLQNGTTHHSDQDDGVHPNGMSARRHPSESHPRSPSASLSPPTPPPSVHLATPPGSGPQVSSSPSSR